MDQSTTLNDRTRVNFVEFLPPDTLRIILNYLPFYERIRCAQVCKRLEKLSKESDGFVDIDMQGFPTQQKIEPYVALDILGFQYPNSVKTLDLTYARLDYRFSLFFYLRMFPNLEKLSLAYAVAENPKAASIISSFMSTKGGKYPKLTFLNMTHNQAGGADDHTIGMVAQNCPNLKVLLLAATEVTENALFAIVHLPQKPAFGSTSTVFIEEPNTSLEVLDISYTGISQEAFATALSKLDERAPALKTLYMISHFPRLFTPYQGKVTIHYQYNTANPSEVLNVNALDQNGATILHNTCLAADIALVKKLVEQYGADVNAKKALPTANTIHPKLNPWSPIHPVTSNKQNFPINPDANTGQRPLHMCILLTQAMDKMLAIAKYLLDHGADVNAGDAQEQTPLMLAIKRSNLEMIRFLLDNGADVNKKDTFGWTASHYVMPKSLPVFKDLLTLLLEHGADFNAVANDKQTMTTLCLDLGDMQKLEYLITDCGVSLSHEAHSGLVTYALGNNEDTILDDLARLGAPMGVTKEASGTPLIYALSGRASINVITTILKNGGAETINTLNASGKAAIHYLYQVPSQELDAYISVLLDHGADLLLKSSTGSTAFMYMIGQNPNDQALQTMIKYGYSVNEQDNNGWSTLHAAVMALKTPVVKFLVQHQANVNVQDCKGITPLAAICRSSRQDSAFGFRSSASSTQREEIINILLDNGASLSVQDKLTGNTPLHWMAANKTMSVGLYKPTNIRNFNNELPLHVAVRHGNFALANKILNEDHVDVNTPGPYGQTILLTALCKFALITASCDPESIATSLPKWDSPMFAGYPTWYNQSNLEDSHWANPSGYNTDEFFDFITTLLANPSIDINAKDVQNVTPLHVVFALEEKSTGGLFGAKQISPSGSTYLSIARTLLRKGADVNAQDSLGDTALHKVLKKNSTKKQNAVRLLLKYGANPAIMNHLGRSALCYAEVSDLHSILATPGIKLNSVDPQTGNTLLHNCSKWAWATPNTIELGKLLDKLLQAGVDPNLTNLQGHTALHLSCIHGYLRFAVALASHPKTDVNVPNTHTEQTALHYALRYRSMNAPDAMFLQQDIIGVLLKRGADLYIRDKNGQTPLDNLSPEGQEQLKALREEVKSSTIEVPAPPAQPFPVATRPEAQNAFRQLEDPFMPNPWKQNGRLHGQPTSLFGTPAQPITSLFGRPQGNSLFGGLPQTQPLATGGLFGQRQPTTSLFGATPQNQSNLFGTPQPTTSLFGNRTIPSNGVPTTFTGFGNNVPLSTNSTAQPTQAPSSSLFSSPGATPQPSSSASTATSFGFWVPPSNPPTTFGAPVGNNTPTTTTNSFSFATAPISAAAAPTNTQPSTVPSTQAASIFGTASMPTASLFGAAPQNQSNLFGTPQQNQANNNQQQNQQ